MKLLAYQDYREFLKDWVEGQDRGESLRLARAARVHPSLVSLVLRGERDLSTDQGFLIGKFLQFTDFEMDYFMLLIGHSRSVDSSHRSFLRQKIEGVQKEQLNISKRVQFEKSLSEEQRSLFYSTWMYSAVRLYASVGKHGVTVDDIAYRFELDLPKVKQVTGLLINWGLLQEDPVSGRLTLGHQRTFLDRTSPHLAKHHSNWRIRALQRFDDLLDEELMFTSTLSLSRKDFLRLREKLAEFIAESYETVKNTDPEDVACINIDLFWVKLPR